MTPSEYIAKIKAELIADHLVDSFEMVETWEQPDRGYLRIRMWLKNGDFVEAAEYFVVSNAVCVTERYRHQWMDHQRTQLRRRWDNVEHYPDLPNFPHHVHFADDRVEPGEPLGIIDLLEKLKFAICNS
jgi:hypothetical protein